MAGLSVPLDEVVHFDVVTHNPGTGGRVTATSITFDVFEEATDTAIRANQTLTERVGATGVFRGTDTISAANGYEVGKYYSIIAEATAGGVVGQVVALSFRVVAAESVAGVPEVDVTHIVGGLVPTPNTTGIPDVNVREWLDVAVTLSTGNKPDVNVDEWGDVLLATTNTLVDWNDAGRLDAILDLILTDTGTTLDNHLTDIKGTSFVKDTHSLIDITAFVDLIDDGTSGLAKIATDVADILIDTAVIGTLGAGLTDIGGLGTDAISAASLSSAAVDKIRDGLLPTQNVAFSNIEFLFVAASDHVTPVTGATGTAATRSIDGGAFGSGTGTLAEVGNGIYQYDASQADMNGGVITFRFTGSGGTPGAPDDTFLTIVTGGGV